MLTLTELYDEMLRLSRQLNAAIDHMTTAAHDHAEADNQYRMARAKAWLNADGTVGARNATADLATGKERYEARLADGMRQAGLEAVRSRRQQISALQSLSGAFRAEAEYGRTSPNLGP